MADHLIEMQIAAGEAHDLLMRWQLIRVRLHHKLTIETVAERMGCAPRDVIQDMELVDSNPTLGTVRRYALAVGALLTRDVVPEIIAEPEAES
ncbi:hypothetical protein ATK74_1774 [Propionicimonas paludicola]|uniref:Helix-turn-helix protein n=1 Tax=Propionicimonas paludicola TaxID=185243 RepID=A0A2A9CSQ0_9ACTN|nr:helix-turn-helix transcriptional regulator [Propionicimonas paludicola]PFG17211.1 hypothetical protein ATK74_1774 [Propionicimonas paludicola]